MTEQIFFTLEGNLIPHVTESQMREVDRIAVEDFRLGILQMMENAGRNLALHAMEMLDNQPGKIITCAAGSGGNGGGGICAARHLHNRGYRINLLLTRPFGDLQGAAKDQLEIMLNSIKEKILALPDDTIVWPGHNYGGSPTSTIAQEKKHNIYITDFELA